MSWRIVEILGVEGLSFAFMGVLARLLTPADFGVVAVAGFFTVLCRTVLFGGLPEAIVQAETLSDERRDSVLWANLMLGIFLAIVLGAVAWPAAHLLGEPSLAWVMVGLAPMAPAFAVIGVYQACLRRRMSFRDLSIRGLVSIGAGGIAGTALALGGAGVWSLVGQQLIYALTNVVALLLLSRWLPRWRIIWAEVRAFARFGREVTSWWILETLGQSGLTLILAYFLSSAEVGLFFLARRIIFSLSMLSFWSINELALPLLSRLQTERDRHREAVYSSLRVAALICVPLFGGLALTAAPLVELLFGERWLASTTSVQLLALACIPKALMAVGGQIFTSLGNPRRAMHISALTNPLLIVLVTIMAPHGITAAALAVALAYSLSAPLTIVGLCRDVGLDLGRLAREQAPIWIAAVAMAAVVQGIRGLEGPAWSALVQIILESGVGAVSFALVLTVLSPRFVLWLIGFARAGLASEPRG